MWAQHRGETWGVPVSQVNSAGKNHSPRQTHFALLLFLLHYCNDNNNAKSCEIWPWRHWDGLKLWERFCALYPPRADLPSLAWKLSKRNTVSDGKVCKARYISTKAPRRHKKGVITNTWQWHFLQKMPKLPGFLIPPLCFSPGTVARVPTGVSVSLCLSVSHTCTPPSKLLQPPGVLPGDQGLCMGVGETLKSNHLFKSQLPNS